MDKKRRTPGFPGDPTENLSTYFGTAPNGNFDRANEGIAQAVGSMKEASGTIEKAVTGLDATN
jgi:hypothetical protein